MLQECFSGWSASVCCSFSKSAHFWELEGWKFQVLFLFQLPEILYVYALTLSAQAVFSPTPAGNRSCIHSSHSWFCGMQKMPYSYQPTHPITTGSFLFLGKSNILWEEASPEECRNSSKPFTQEITTVALGEKCFCHLDCQSVMSFLLT